MLATKNNKTPSSVHLLGFSTPPLGEGADPGMNDTMLSFSYICRAGDWRCRLHLAPTA